LGGGGGEVRCGEQRREEERRKKPNPLPPSQYGDKIRSQDNIPKGK